MAPPHPLSVPTLSAALYCRARQFRSACPQEKDLPDFYPRPESPGSPVQTEETMRGMVGRETSASGFCAQTVLEAMTSPLAVLDGQGVIRQVNTAWRQYGEVNGLQLFADGIGVNYLHVCDDSSLPAAQDAAAGIRSVMQGTRPAYLQVYSGHGPDQAGWFQLRVTRLGAGPCVLVAHENVTEQTLAEQVQQDRNEILEMVVKGQPLPEILNEIEAMVNRQSPGSRCSVLPLEHHRLQHPGGCRAAIIDGRPHLTTDMSTAPGCLGCRQARGPHANGACLSLPIQDGSGKILGALALRGAAAHPPAANALALLDQARHLAAVAVEHHRLTEELEYRATHDVLTGLANRQLFERHLHEVLTSTACSEGPVSLLFIDLDEFKDVNDHFGHAAGDAVLRLVAERLQRCVRPGDTLARISGDEFTVLLPRADEAAACGMARRIHEALAAPLVLPDREITVTASIGVSVAPSAGRDPGDLQRTADLALYAAKKRKPETVVFHPALAAQASERFRLAADLRRAAGLGELELHYQPLVDLESLTVIGAEALARWRHPEFGLVPPSTFIPLAEDTGLIVELGEWILREACRQGATWMRGASGRDRAPLRVAVNVSALQFAHPDFVALVATCLEDTGLPAAQLELELTEGVVMKSVAESVERMRQLRALGVALSVDDFGTGYSSLSYLSQLPLTCLKVDRSFVSNLRAMPAFAVVRSIISLAQSLNLETVAEGVESEEERAVLRELGCRTGQGYLFARPLPATHPFWNSAV